MVFTNRNRLDGIPGVHDFRQVRHIQGLSPGMKYYAKDKSGREILLKLFDISERRSMENEVELLKLLASNNIPTNRLLDIGTCNGGRNYYIMLTWIPGADIERILRSREDEISSSLGRQAGMLLRQIHCIPLPDASIHTTTLAESIDDCLFEFSSNETLIQRYPSMRYFIAFLEDNKEISSSINTQSILHGDYHAKNLVYRGTVSVIDWSSGTIGNPIEDFVRNVISAITSPIFASAQICSYFDGLIPDSFWYLLKVYTAIHELRITKYNLINPAGYPDFVGFQHRLILEQYDKFNKQIPAYFREI